MAELIIPNDLTHDCGNCQGLCCMAHKHNPQDGFPILNAKPAGIPCENLSIGRNPDEKLYGCNIYPKLEEDGWTTCTKFSCYGAGQAVTGFFKELGVSWAEKQEELTDNQWRIRILNFRYGYQALHYVFQRLDSLKQGMGEEAYQAAKKSVALASGDFCVAMEKTDQDLDPNYWAKVHFKRAIDDAIQPFKEQYIRAQYVEQTRAIGETHGWMRTAVSGVMEWARGLRNDKSK